MGKKGGDKVLGAYRKLKAKAFLYTDYYRERATRNAERRRGLTIIPFLDKSKPKDLERLCDILYQSHF